jgi:hypothetical protein
MHGRIGRTPDRLGRGFRTVFALSARAPASPKPRWFSSHGEDQMWMKTLRSALAALLIASVNTLAAGARPTVAEETAALTTSNMNEQEWYKPAHRFAHMHLGDASELVKRWCVTYARDAVKQEPAKGTETKTRCFVLLDIRRKRLLRGRG